MVIRWVVPGTRTVSGGMGNRGFLMNRRTFGVLVVLAMIVAALVPAGQALASGSHSQSKTFSTCAYTISHSNSNNRAIASTVGNNNCYKARVRLQYRFGGDTVWGPTTTWYNAVWYLDAPTTSRTVKSTHRVQHWPSYQWSGTSTLY